ncbi:MAG: glycosyltransferase [Rhodospirillales bacterium]|nr:glycosyltransferase [Rhodospirillales bacterium]
MTALAALSLLAWVVLLAAHGGFWRDGPTLPAPARPIPGPPVAVVVPARDEAAQIGACLASLLAQDYAGAFRVILVDDASTDGTGAIARAIADPRLTVLAGAPRPAGWSGKLWAVAQGIAEAGEARLILLTDADILHEPGHLSALVAKAERDDLDMVSEMVALDCSGAAARALVPAFVYFFQLLYPFAWVNDPLSATAAAAGGTILIRARALARIAGIGAVRGALIDDVALARAVKRGGRIWLGHAALARSVRPYPDVAELWRMIARTAYVQLRFSPLLLALTAAAMTLVWLIPPLALLTGPGAARILGLAAWLAMAASYIPSLRRCGLSPARAVTLPGIAAFYLAATLGSAWNHYAGRGVAWKGRAYAPGAGA